MAKAGHEPYHEYDRDVRPQEVAWGVFVMSRWKLFLILLLVLVILAVKFLPWYVLVGLVVLFVLSAKFIGRMLLYWLFTVPFRAKGAVLRGATATVHSLERVPAPPPAPARAEEEGVPQDSQPREPRDYYRL